MTVWSHSARTLAAIATAAATLAVAGPGVLGLNPAIEPLPPQPAAPSIVNTAMESSVSMVAAMRGGHTAPGVDRPCNAEGCDNTGGSGGFDGTGFGLHDEEGPYNPRGNVPGGYSPPGD